MRSANDQDLLWHATVGLYSGLLFEFDNYVQQAGIAEKQIRLRLGTARHFLAWTRASGTRQKAVDDAALLAFRDHECRCLVSLQGNPWPRREHGLGAATMRHAIRFVQFLEISGKTDHPDKIQFGFRPLKDFLEHRAKEGFRPSALRDYRKFVRHFLIWLHRSRTPIKAIAADVVGSFPGHDCLCHGYAVTPNKLRTARRCEVVIKLFANYLAERGVAPDAFVAPRQRKQTQTGGILSLAGTAPRHIGRINRIA